MDISTSHASVSLITSPLKPSELSTSSGSLPASDVEVSIAPDEAPLIASTANPTYEKPISPSATGNSENNDAISADNIIKGTNVDDEESATGEEKEISASNQEKDQNGEAYTEAEIELISTLKQRDVEVITHERAHASVGGQYAGSPSYNYKTGPDGVKYAVSGEVSIDTSRIPGDPQATLQKAQQIKAAALAPAEPSGQDRKVAAKADQMASQARKEILEENNGGDVSNNRHSHHENSVPEHFTGTQNLSSEYDSVKQAQMSERNLHINHFYQNSSHSTLSPKFTAQA